MLTDASRRHCSSPWREVYVGVTGEVFPCCMSRQVIGDLRRSSAQHIWGCEMDAFRGAMTAGVPPQCQGCFAKKIEGEKGDGGKVTSREHERTFSGDKGVETFQVAPSITPCALAAACAPRVPLVWGAVAILTPFSGKEWAIDAWLDALRAALPEDARLLWIDNSCSPDFHARLEAAAATMGAPVILWADPSKSTRGDGSTSKDGTVCWLYRELRRRVPAGVQTVLTLEDDVLPEPSALRLLVGVSRNHPEAEVGGIVPHRGRPHFGADSGVWDFDVSRFEGGSHFVVPTRTAEVQEIFTCGFGMTAFDRRLFDRLPFRRDTQHRLWWGFDRLASEDARRLGGRVLACWEARSAHLEHPKL